MIPAEVAHREYHAEQDRLARLPKPTAEDREQALTEIADKLIAGGSLGGWTMASVIDCEVNESAGREFSAALATLLNPYADEASGAALWLRVLAWQKALVAKHLPAEMIYERAEWIARDA